jgi:hypothetical protein
MIMLHENTSQIQRLMPLEIKYVRLVDEISSVLFCRGEILLILLACFLIVQINTLTYSIFRETSELY